MTRLRWLSTLLFGSRAEPRASTLGALSFASMLIGAVGLAPQMALGQAAPPANVRVVDPIDIPPQHDPLARAWDVPGDRGGFYLRATFGLGFQNTGLGPASWQSDASGLRAVGFANGFGLDLGYLLTPRLALHLDSQLGMMWSGGLSEDFGVAGGRDTSARIAAYGLAPAATVFLPHEFYLKGGFGVGFAHVAQPGHSNWTDPGFFMDVGVGNDVYIDDHVAVGLGMSFVYMHLDDNNRLDRARVRQLLFNVSVAYDSI